MGEIEVKLREGMTANGIAAAAQEKIILAITSFALLAYASAWLKRHYVAAFTAAPLNNQPIGFYSPTILVKDAQRHGLRLGLRYVKGLRAEAGEAIVRARPFTSIDDLARRVRVLRKDEMNRLAEIGALNPLRKIHRRHALWQSERAARASGPLRL